MKTRNISRSPYRRAPVILWLFLFFNLYYVHSPAQIAEWNFENITSSVPGLPIPASNTMDGVNASASIRGGNNNGSPDECFGAESWSTNFWPTTAAPDPNEYIEFSVRVTGEDHLGVSGFSFYSSASSSNSARSFTAYYSTDNFATRQFILTSTHSAGGCHPHTRSLSISLAPGQSLKIRIHSFGQNVAAQAATIRMDNVRILGAILPVTLSSFSAQPEESQVELQWSTANEVNNDHFTVERSRDGISFEAIGRVDGRGDSHSEQWYRFTDHRPHNGQSYYRLRQVDLDGTQQIHQLVEVHFDGRPVTAMKIWPTLVQGRLQVQLNKPNSKGQLQLWDMNGIMIRQYVAMEVEHSGSLNLEDLPAGPYALRYTSGQMHDVQRFIKQ